MRNLTFEDLRIANAARSKRWHGEKGVDQWSLSEWGVALGGKVGEALNIIKKLNRVDQGLTGNKETKRDLLVALAHELADIQIYLDLLAQKARVNLAGATIQAFNRKSVEHGFPERLQGKKA